MSQYKTLTGKIRRHHLLLLLLAIALLGQSGVAAMVPQRADSTIYPGNGHRLSQQQFLEQYGRDDSSRALILYYWGHRSTGARLSLYSGGIFVVSTVLVLAIVSAAAGPGFLALLAAVLFSVIGTLSAIPLLIGLVIFLRNPRRKLARMLKAYHAGAPIPGFIRSRPRYQRLVALEQK